jgi:hypothetical protein
MLRVKQSKSWMYGIAIFAVIICFIPPFLGETSSLDGANLQTALNSNAYQLTAVASIAVTSTGVVECFLDIACGSALETDAFERLFLHLSLALPSVFAITINTMYPDFSGAVEAFAFIKILQEILYIAPVCVIFLRRDEGFFSPVAMSAVYIIYSIGYILKLYFILSDNNTLHPLTDTLFYFPCVIAIISFGFFWIHIYRKSLMGDLSPDLINSGITSICLVALLVTLTMIDLLTGETTLAGYGVVNLSASRLVRSAFTVLVTVLPGRLSRLQFQRSTTKLDMKSLFVRYVSHEVSELAVYSPLP